MMKYTIKLISIIIATSLLLYDIIITKNFNFYIPLITTVIMIILFLLLEKYEKVDRREYKFRLLLILSCAFVLQSGLYLTGTFTGYTKNISSIFNRVIKLDKVLVISLFLILKELLRYLTVKTKEKNKHKYFVLQAVAIIYFVLLDVYLSTKIYRFTSYIVIFEFLADIIIPSMSKNIFLSALSYETGYLIGMIYVLIMDIIIFILPVTYNMNELIKSVILLVFPYLLYLGYKKTNKKRFAVKKNETKKYKTSIIAKVISCIFIALLVALVSREFKYSMIGIGSESMTGTINKGDAIIYRRYEENEAIEGKVIVFKKQERLIVHRVVKVFEVDGKLIYQTKGDHNRANDNWVVYPEEIIGVTNMRIRFIAWPSVLINELF